MIEGKFLEMKNLRNILITDNQLAENFFELSDSFLDASSDWVIRRNRFLPESVPKRGVVSINLGILDTFSNISFENNVGGGNYSIASFYLIDIIYFFVLDFEIF